MYGHQSSLNSSVLRQFWTVVEGFQSSTLLQLNDRDLAYQVLNQLKDEAALAPEEVCALNSYMVSRIPLIRDLAQARYSPA
jgi:hypothetical protein